MRRYLCFAVSLVRRSATSPGVRDFTILKSRGGSRIGCHLLQMSVAVVRSPWSVVSSDAPRIPVIALRRPTTTTVTTDYGLRTTDYGLRTTDEIHMPDYDAIVIGGGPAGSSAAISLVS